MLLTLFWLLLLCYFGWLSFQVAHAYYANWQVQEIFTSLTKNMDGEPESAVHDKMRKLFSLKYMDEADLPGKFTEQLSITYIDAHLQVSSNYGVAIWPLGRVSAVDEYGEYDPDALAFADALRDRLHFVLEFEPYAYADGAEQLP